MDYFVWGTVGRDTNRASCNTKAELVARIKAVFAAIPRDMVVRACARFRKRVQAAIDAEGGKHNDNELIFNKPHVMWLDRKTVTYLTA
uniref:Uncharacterized protein n=1 Tax=Anopheles epiroticus TaxID=199890 RepID=A0A182PTF3_9DIPT